MLKIILQNLLFAIEVVLNNLWAHLETWVANEWFGAYTLIVEIGQHLGGSTMALIAEIGQNLGGSTSKWNYSSSSSQHLLLVS